MTLASTSYVRKSKQVYNHGRWKVMVHVCDGSRGYFERRGIAVGLSFFSLISLEFTISLFLDPEPFSVLRCPLPSSAKRITTYSGMKVNDGMARGLPCQNFLLFLTLYLPN